MNEDKKTLLKKLMHDTLDEEERERLLHDPGVEKLMHTQWKEETDLSDLNSPVGKSIWEKVVHQIDTPVVSHRLFIYKIVAIAASFLLLLGIGGMMYLKNEQSEQYMYVVSSGVRCIETVLLPDGTEVRMGANSRLTYPSDFNGKTRDVKLVGQAFFNVAKDKDKPFTVHTNSMDVMALGTSFEVFNYDFENKIETILLEGKVKVGLGNSNSKHRKEVMLTPDEMLIYDKEANTVLVKDVNAESYSGWKNQGVLSFENAPLSTIISRLEPWYGRKIKCSKEIAEEYRFTFKVRDESLERILFMLNNSSPVRYKEVEGDYELYVKTNK